MPFDLRPFQPADWPALVPILAQCFNAPESGWDTFRARIGDPGLYVLSEQGQVVGGCAVYGMGQVWMDRSVPLGGVAGVGVAPHVRGRGAARVMMAGVLADLADRGLPVAGLYPATQTVYRAVGYEQAGERWQYQAPLASLSGLRMEVEARPIDPLDPAARAELVRRYRPEHGNLDRSVAIWARLCQPYTGRRYAWLLGEGGYLVLHHAGDGPHWDLEVVDLQAPDGPTMRTLLALLASHRSLADRVRWQGCPADPLLAFFPEPTWAPCQVQRWMLRLADVAAALQARGWPEGARGELHLSLRDPLIPRNDGRFVLHVADGRGELSPGGRGELAAPVSALGPLYSGYLRASALARMGWLQGSDAALRLADALFMAPTPWMREMY